MIYKVRNKQPPLAASIAFLLPLVLSTQLATRSTKHQSSLAGHGVHRANNVRSTTIKAHDLPPFPGLCKFFFVSASAVSLTMEKLGS